MTKDVFHGNRKEANQKTVDIITEAINKLLNVQDHVVLAIPGGRSVSGIFKILKDNTIPWNKVHIFMVDERMVMIEDNESNFKLAKESFIQELVDKRELPEQNIHPFILSNGIESYENELINL